MYIVYSKKYIAIQIISMIDDSWDFIPTFRFVPQCLKFHKQLNILNIF